jgi:hypothetical protein
MGRVSGGRQDGRGCGSAGVGQRAWAGPRAAGGRAPACALRLVCAGWVGMQQICVHPAAPTAVVVTGRVGVQRRSQGYGQREGCAAVPVVGGAAKDAHTRTPHPLNTHPISHAHLSSAPALLSPPPPFPPPNHALFPQRREGEKQIEKARCGIQPHTRLSNRKAWCVQGFRVQGKGQWGGVHGRGRGGAGCGAARRAAPRQRHHHPLQ